MNKFMPVIALAVIGLIAGVVLGEFFPRLIDNGISGAVGSALSGPFSDYRNELAFRYGAFGAALGAAIGVVLMLLKGRR